MRLRQVLIAMAIVLITCAAESYACQCRERQPPCAQYWEADAVFVGSVTEITQALFPYSDTNSLEFDMVKFTVERAFRGVDDDRIELAVWRSSCMYSFQAGKRYLVYAYRNSHTNKLDTTYCSRTAELPKADEDLRYINGLGREAPGEAITGKLIDGAKRLTGVRVVAEGMGRRYRSVSDGRGWFNLPVAAPGRYKVRIFLPHGVGVAGTQDLLEKIAGTRKTPRHYVVEYVIDVQAGRCAYIDVPLLI